MQILPANNLPSQTREATQVLVQAIVCSLLDLQQISIGQLPSSKTSAAHPEYCSPADITASQVLPCHISAMLLSLAPYHSQSQDQNSCPSMQPSQHFMVGLNTIWIEVWALHEFVHTGANSDRADMEPMDKPM